MDEQDIQDKTETDGIGYRFGLGITLIPFILKIHVRSNDDPMMVN